MTSMLSRDRAEEKGNTAVTGSSCGRSKAYLESKGIPKLVQDFFDDLFQHDKLPANPYPDLVRRFRIAESAQGLYRSIEDDDKASARMQNTIATSPSLSGVTYIQGSPQVWGMPHMLRMADVERLKEMQIVMDANELCLRAKAHEFDRCHKDCHVNVWVALTGPAALAGKLFTEFWAEVRLAVNVEIVAPNFELAVKLFADNIRAEANGCQGSAKCLLQRVVIDFPSRQNGVKGGERAVWRPGQLHDNPEAFTADIKTSLLFRPSVTMTYLLLSPEGSHRAIGGPIMTVHRSYTMHFNTSIKANTSMTNQPFRSLYDGIFLSEAHAKYYGEIFRTQGLSFAVEGVSGAKEYLAGNVERAREIGDTLGVYTSLLTLTFLAGVNEDKTSAGQAAVDVSRVPRSAAARHRSRRNLCDSILLIMGLLGEWVQGSQPILTWGGDANSDSEDNENDGKGNHKNRCRSSKDLLQTWLRTAHLLFWGWRRDVLRYLDEDRHSDVAVVKAKVKQWTEEISDTARMGLRLPILRWHEHGRTIVIADDGKRDFLRAVTFVHKRLSSLSAWLHCLDLSLSWDAAKVCDRVHARHLEERSKKDDDPPQDGWTNILGFRARASTRFFPLPTATGLLQLQRSWLDEVVAAAHVRGGEIAKNSGKRKSRRPKGMSASSTAAAVEAALVKGVRYVSAPATPDSTRASEDLDVRLAVVETLREDVVPEAFAHEISLMKYAADTRIDKSLYESISEVLTSVLAPNPFPMLTDALAVRSMSFILRRLDSEKAFQRGAPKLEPVLGEEHNQIFAVRGAQKGDAKVYGSKPALTDIDVEVVVALFGVLPPLAGWVLDELGGTCTNVDIGISGCSQQHGLHSHHVVPSNMTVMLACAFDLNLQSGTTPMEYFAHCAVHCACTAHTKSELLMIGLTAQNTSEENLASPAVGEALYGQRFLLQKIVEEPEEVEDELVHLQPKEIMLEALVPYPIPTGGGALVPLSIRFIHTSDRGDGSGCSETLAAAMFYNCVFSTAKAAENAAARHSSLKRSSGLQNRHIKRIRRSVLERVDSRAYFEAYQIVHHLRTLQQVVVCSGDESVPTTPAESDIDRSHEEYKTASGSKTWKVPSASGTADAEEVAVAATATTDIRRMLKGPAGRLRHAHKLLDVLRIIVTGGQLSAATVARLDDKVLRGHAEYCTSYLLDTLAEQPLVRFEGAGHSIRLRARLLLDRVTEITDVVGDQGLRKHTAGAAGADATTEAAGDLARAVTSMLEIVQHAVEYDTHRCCPDMDRLIHKYRAIENATEIKPPGGDVERGRRAAVKTSGVPKKSAGTRNSSKSGGGRRGHHHSVDDNAER